MNKDSAKIKHIKLELITCAFDGKLRDTEEVVLAIEVVLSI